MMIFIIISTLEGGVSSVPMPGCHRRDGGRASTAREGGSVLDLASAIPRLAETIVGQVPPWHFRIAHVSHPDGCHPWCRILSHSFAHGKHIFLKSMRNSNINRTNVLF